LAQSYQSCAPKEPWQEDVGFYGGAKIVLEEEDRNK